MANVKISALPASAAALSPMQLATNNAGTTERVTVAQIASLLGISGGNTTGNSANVTGVVAIANGGTGQSNQQAALNNITNTGAADDGDVLMYTGGNAQFAPFTLSTLNLSSTYEPNNLAVGGHQVYYANVNVNPLQNSPDDSVTAFTIQANFDTNGDDFDLGDAGQAAIILNLGFFYNNSAGSVYGTGTFLNMGGTFGNGVDESTLLGFSFANATLQVAAEAMFSGPMHGYGFSPGFHADSTTDAGFNVQAFYDTANFPVDVYGYTSYTCGVQIDTIKNNFNFNGVSITPTITTLEGNAGVNLVSLGGTFTNMGTGGFSAIQCGPTITHLTENATMINVGMTSTDGDSDWTGVNITSGQVNTTGTVRGLVISVDPDDFGNSLAISADGHCALSVELNLASSLGQANGHQVGGTIVIPDATAITGTDVFGNNMAFTVDLGDATSSWTAASVVGITTLGFVGAIVGDGDANGAITFCLNGFSAGNNGDIDRVNNFYAAGVPGGGTGTIDEHVLFYGDLPGGTVATDSWGVRIEHDSLENYMPQLAIATSSRKVANASVGLEIGGVTKALLVSSMTETQRDALTPLPGMIILNTTADEFQGYRSGAWETLG